MSLLRRTFLNDILGAAAVIRHPGRAGAAAREAEGDGTFEVHVVDAESKQPIAARVRLTDAQDRPVVPLGHSEQVSETATEGDVQFQARRFAYVDGGFSVDAARLPVRYEVVKGHAYSIARGELILSRERRGPLIIPLFRSSSMTPSGWYSGDIHIHHISPKTCRLEMDAEDLHVANILTSDFTKDQDQFHGALDRHSSAGRLIYVNQEFRNPHLGHVCLLNLKRVVEPVIPQRSEGHPLLLDACEEARQQGGYVSWAHFPSWPGVESPLDVAMDKLDGLEILSVLQPHAISPFLKEIGPDWESNDGLRLWYRYLNCGFRLTATAGTDKMTPFVTVGANRVFARVDGPFTYESWIRALRAGRTFVSNSPVLSFTVNEKEAGEVLLCESGRKQVLRIAAKAQSQFAYHRLEILCNGAVIAETSPSGPSHTAELRIEHPVSKSCWLAARAYEKIDSYLAKGVKFEAIHSRPATLLNDYFGTRRPEAVFAHSSPVYVVCDNQPIRSWDDAQYYVRYLTRSIKWLEKDAKFAKPSDKQASIEAFRAGIAVYEKRAREAAR